MNNKVIIGIDTSNYTTSCAVCSLDGVILENYKELLPVKIGENGLRQSDAVFAHVKNFQIISKKIKEKHAEYEIVAIGYSSYPRDVAGSYMPCFLVGCSVAEMISALYNIPSFSFSHQAGHIQAALYSSKLEAEGEFVAFHVSGGTTEILLVTPNKTSFNVSILGGSVDLHAGQAIDRIGVKMGLKFPCGKEIERLAIENNSDYWPQWNNELDRTLFGNADKKKNNLFGEVTVANGYTTNYMDNPYAKMYSLANMGNSKKNIEVCHDADNDFECCVENGDNQYPGQKMIDLQGVYTIGDDFVVVNIPDISEETKVTCSDGIVRSARNLWEGAMDTIYGFRYPDGIKEVKKKDPVYAESMITGWYRLVNWMVHSNPQPAYEKIEFIDGYQIIPFKTKEEFKAELENNNIIYIKNNEGDFVEASEDDFNVENIYYMDLTAAEAYNKTKNDLWTWDDVETRTGHIAVTGNYDSTKDYFRKTPHIYGATDEKLPEPVTFNAYTFQGYKVPDSRVIDGVTYEITTKNEKGETVKANTFQADYTPMVKDKIVSTYAGTYEYDTRDYRMAKMLSECEEYLCMDSIIYHFLFIERHSMVDNVAKNTFWSTEDGLVWNLTKDYDNDTSDGNDNQGKLSLVYGYEPGDVGPDGASIFNAGNSVWLSFIGGLQEVCQPMFQQLDSLGAWSASNYLQAHNNFQKVIPERCWIEDYHRKYVRPYEIYDSDMFLEMNEGGQKTHQRAQYETYQNQYISSKYFGTTCRNNYFLIRSNGKSLDNIPVTLYADCYIRGSFGTGTEKSNLSMRCKRNTRILLTAPIDDASDGTVYIYPANLFQTMGDVDTGLNSYQLKQFDASGARKLRTLGLGIASGAANSTLTTVTFKGTENLEKLYVANFTNIYGDLDLGDSPGLQYLDARNSNFSTVSIAKNAPIETMLLNCPSLINFANLTKLKPLTNAEGLMQDWRPLYYVYLDSIDEGGINSKRNILDPAFSYPGNRYETVYYKNAEEFEADEDVKYIKLSDDVYQEISEYDATIGTYFKKLAKLKGYKLKNVKWTIDNASEINLSNKTISILEKLKNSDTIVNDVRIETADALDGVLNITASACGNGNSEDALAIYEKYSCSPGSIKST
jgi:hypothetical protein